VSTIAPVGLFFGASRTIRSSAVEWNTVQHCTEKALWKLHWFLRDFGYDQDLLREDQVDEKAPVNLRGVVRTTHLIRSGRTFQNLEGFAPESSWEELSCATVRGRNSHDL